MTTGEKIYRLRRQLNLTQEQLADLLNVTRQAISRWEGDISLPESDKLLSLSKVSMADISESSKFAHISDHVYFIYRLNQAMFPEYSGDYLFIKSLKQRTNSLPMEYTFIPFSKNFEILEKNKYVDLIIKENN